jgi:Ni/Fe-hydrogenase subunit HybB-like protein
VKDDRVGGKIKRAKRGRDDSELITASEIACFAYCPEQWRLEYGLELLPANQPALDAGTRHHASKAVAERVADGIIGLGRVLVVATLLLLLVLWLLWR